GDRSTVMVESVGHGRRAREGTGRELHHPGRLAAPQRRAAFSADEGTSGGDGGGDVGGGQRRSQQNADYQYGKRRLRQIDGRIRFLRKRIDAARVVDPETPRSG